MKDRILKLLWDVREACNAIEQFVQGKTDSDYLKDNLLRSAVERQLMILGEALYQANRIDQDLSKHITDLRKIIGFRHLLVHDYSSTQNETVWGIVENNVPQLGEEVARLLPDEDPTE